MCWNWFYTLFCCGFFITCDLVCDFWRLWWWYWVCFWGSWSWSWRWSNYMFHVCEHWCNFIVHKWVFIFWAGVQMWVFIICCVTIMFMKLNGSRYKMSWCVKFLMWCVKFLCVIFTFSLCCNWITCDMVVGVILVQVGGRASMFTASGLDWAWWPVICITTWWYATFKSFVFTFYAITLWGAALIYILLPGALHLASANVALMMLTVVNCLFICHAMLKWGSWSDE